MFEDNVAHLTPPSPIHVYCIILIRGGLSWILNCSHSVMCLYEMLAVLLMMQRLYTGPYCIAQHSVEALYMHCNHTKAMQAHYAVICNASVSRLSIHKQVLL